MDYSIQKPLIAALVAVPMMASTTVAANTTTFGVGSGSLYNGLGLNVGRTDGRTLKFAAIGCGGWSIGSSGGRSTCGVGIGYVSTKELPGRNQAIGLSVGLNFDTHELKSDGEGARLIVTPAYHYFINGISESGINLGIGPQLTFEDPVSASVGLMVNIGYQF